jgi:hypothetical protein
MRLDDIGVEISEERNRQQALWGREHLWGKGDCSSQDVPDTVKAIVLGEECGEVARAVLERDDDALIRELVQVAAVCVAWLEAL